MTVIEKIVKVGCWVFILIFFLLLQMCGGVFSPLPYASLAPFQGKVVDGETKEPIEGAVILAVYYYTVYGSPGGSNSYVQDGQETLTDKNGHFQIPRTRRWFVLHRGYPEGNVIIFKPGYGVFPKHRKSKEVLISSSPIEKQVAYELPRLKTLEERKKTRINSYHEIPYEHRKLYFEAENKERLFLGYDPLPIPDEE